MERETRGTKQSDGVELTAAVSVHLELKKRSSSSYVDVQFGLMFRSSDMDPVQGGQQCTHTYGPRHADTLYCTSQHPR